jgi:membrane protease subunit (stomatin/prohibitin family)
MEKSDNDPLDLGQRLYTIEELGSVLRTKFGDNNYISNVMLAEIFLAKHPIYSCKIKKPKNHISQKSCGCC